MADAAASFRPEMVLVSCGFDAHARDPLGGLTVTTEAFAEATRIVISVAEAFAGGRLVSVLEGGYDLQALSACAATHARVLLGDPQ
jgi:acetoin utilization deacetylase AcuC-like enzyme